MNVIYVYAQTKDKLNKEEAHEVCNLYMNGLTYKEAMDKVSKTKRSKIETVLDKEEVLNKKEGGNDNGR